jgi:hypothetical protein
LWEVLWGFLGGFYGFCLIGLFLGEGGFLVEILVRLCLLGFLGVGKSGVWVSGEAWLDSAFDLDLDPLGCGDISLGSVLEFS